MRMTRIITAKIQPDIFNLIESGVKRFEVRSEDFNNASIIRYRSSETGETLGYYEINEYQSEIHAGSADLLALIASVSADVIDDCGLLDVPNSVYVTEIGYRIDDLEAWMEEQKQ